MSSALAVLALFVGVAPPQVLVASGGFTQLGVST